MLADSIRDQLVKVFTPPQAEVLRKLGERAQAFVACDAIAPVSAELASREGVWVIREGRLLTPAA
jgi:hypothetical protein